MSPGSDINAPWSRVRALKRKLARPLAELRLQRVASELCLEWTCAQADRQPFLGSQAFVIRGAKAGYRLRTFTAVVRYLGRCRLENQPSGPWRLLPPLLPRTPSPQGQLRVEGLAHIARARTPRL